MEEGNGERTGRRDEEKRVARLREDDLVWEGRWRGGLDLTVGPEKMHEQRKEGDRGEETNRQQ